MSAKTPSPIEKRNFLHAPDQKRAPEFGAIGDAFLAKGRDCEALDFFERIPDENERRARVDKVRLTAIERGDAFLLNRIASKATVEKSEWATAAKNARAAGRLRYALKAATAAGDEAQATELRSQLGIAVAPDVERPEDAKIGVKLAGGVVAAIGLPPEPAAPAPSQPPKSEDGGEKPTAPPQVI